MLTPWQDILESLMTSHRSFVAWFRLKRGLGCSIIRLSTHLEFANNINHINDNSAELLRRIDENGSFAVIKFTTRKITVEEVKCQT
jgi:hypothetical protein